MGVGMLQLLLNTYECQHGGQNQTLQEQNHCVKTGVLGDFEFDVCGVLTQFVVSCRLVGCAVRVCHSNGTGTSIYTGWAQ